jgi:Polyketide cyclase / dehydrase and lipid transport
VPTATRGEASIEIAASAGRVYDLVADVTRIGARSPECYRVEWLDGVTAAAVDARFRGHNRIGPIKWSTVCTVTKADAGREFAFSVVSGGGREETRWRYVIEELGPEATRLVESYDFQWCPVLARIAEIPFPRDRQLRRGLVQTLARIKAEAEQG